jgi:hypothetical protein
MKRSFTLFATILALVAATSNSYGQCLTGGSFTATTNNPFDINTEGFTGDFGWSANGSGQLESSGVNLGTSKTLTTSTLFLPSTETTVAWSFNLSGTANVSSYVVTAKYSSGNIIRTVEVCTGGALTTTGANLIFAAVAPVEIIGTNFQLEITFHSTSNGTKIMVVDNFKTNAFNSAIILPVNITYFSASAATAAIKLTWLVSAESNVNRYEIEKSSNGKTFAKIGQVAASGLVTYIYLDSKYSTGSNYYRLKAVDNDGKFKYSSVVLYKVGKNGISLRAYPSPARELVFIQHDKATSTSSLELLSIDGKVLQTIQPTAGTVETSVSLTALKPGLYFVRYVNTNGEIETLKLVKQ